MSRVEGSMSRVEGTIKGNFFLNMLLLNSSSSDHRIVFLLFQFQEDGRDKENKVLGSKCKGGGESKCSENNKPLTVLAWVDG